MTPPRTLSGTSFPAQNYKCNYGEKLMKHFMDNVVSYWFKNIWMLIKDNSWDAWWNKFLILTIPTMSVYIGYIAPDLAQNPSPFAKNPFPLILLIFASVFLLWVLPNIYARNKRFYEGMKHAKRLREEKKMLEERYANKKPY